MTKGCVGRAVKQFDNPLSINIWQAIYKHICICIYMYMCVCVCVGVSCSRISHSENKKILIRIEIDKVLYSFRSSKRGRCRRTYRLPLYIPLSPKKYVHWFCFVFGVFFNFATEYVNTIWWQPNTDEDTHTCLHLEQYVPCMPLSVNIAYNSF